MSYKTSVTTLVCLVMLASTACTTTPPPAATQAPTAQPTSTSIPTTLPPPSSTPTPAPTATPTWTPSPTDTPLPTDTPTPAASPTPYTCTDKLGCLELAPGDPLHIGYLLALSGDAASLGEETLNALQLVAKLQGNLYGHPVELTGLDELCSQQGGRAAALELVEDASLAAVIGPTCSSAARAAMPWLSRAGLAVISPSNTDPILTDPGSGSAYPGYFRTIPGDQWQGAMAARFAAEHLGAQKAAVIYTQNPRFRLIKSFFTEEFEKRGGEGVVEAVLSPDQVNVDAAVSQIAKAAPEVVFLPLTVTSAIAVLQAVRQIPELEGIPLVGPEDLSVPDLSDKAGLAADGLIVSRLEINPPDEAYRTEFLQEYLVEYGSEPTTIFVPYTVDAARMLIAALGRVGVAYPDGTLFIPRQALRDALYEMQGYPGVTGTLSCTPQGDCADLNNIIFYEYQTGIFPPSERVWP